MEHLLDIQNLSKEEILNIINDAKAFKNGEKKSEVEGKAITLMFCENSTRTRCSFEMAGLNLGLKVINFDTAHSSFSKGESLKDTVENLYAIGIRVIVLRHSTTKIIDETLKVLKYPMKFINAGDGTHAHPTQALLDFYTMLEELGTVENKKIAIVGDITHSRVAKSNIQLLSKFGVDIHLCAPDCMQLKEDLGVKNIHFHSNLKEAIKDADIVMALRVQKERHADEFKKLSINYEQDYRISSELLDTYAKKDVLLMHPGPVNRDVELTSELIDSKRGETILKQAHNGVFVRMAILNSILKGND